MGKWILAVATASIMVCGPALAGGGSGGGHGGTGGHGFGGGMPQAVWASQQPNPQFSAEERAHPWGWLHRLFGDDTKASPDPATPVVRK